jgi:hypothetical protein
MHTAEELAIDDFQAKRSPDERYRTAPLKGLWTHMKRGFYHDGRFETRPTSSITTTGTASATAARPSISPRARRRPSSST